MDVNVYIENLKKHCNILEGRKSLVEKNIDNITKERDAQKELAESYLLAQSLLNSTAKSAREKAKTQLEKIVTTALQFVHDDDCEFKIELDQARGVTVANFYISTIVNGEESLQDPETASAGGYVDVVSTALRYAYMKAFNNPVINNAIILDEPGKMVSEGASVRFAQFVKQLGDMFNKQTIMITHNDSLKMIGDHSIEVSKINTVSKISYSTEEEINYAEI